ncbi:MAG: SgcJ/EcaC family oxidoreductase [Gemmatimonadota bacterium]
MLRACTAPDPATTQDAADAVRAWVEAYEKAWNTHEAFAVAAFFSEDADFIVGNGPRIVGRDAVEEWWRSYFSGIDDGRKGTFAIVSLGAIAPEVVLVNINSTTAGHGHSGEALPTRLARGTWVVVQHNGKWQIAVFRALPAEGDVRSGPGRDR